MKEKIIYNSIVGKQSLFWTPDYVEMSAWTEHIPFAFWLMEILRPSMVVELGVHRGNSYFAFCQAAKALNLNTLCYGVDTWRGDEHAGFYDDEIFNKVNGYNASNYAAFSTLVRSTFDEAVNYFVEGSVELLHIDGLHTYEAVKHDFDTWLPKLSENGIVLFHDINVRDRDFGVFRIWEELKSIYPHFQFDFGYGLGVLSLGKQVPDELSLLFREKSLRPEEYYIFLRNIFSERGRFFKSGFDIRTLITQQSGEIGSLNQQLQVATSKEYELSSSLGNYMEDARSVRKQYEALDEVFRHISSKQHQVQQDLLHTTTSLNIMQRERDDLISRVDALESERDQLLSMLQESRAHLTNSENELKTSRSESAVLKAASGELETEIEVLYQSGRKLEADLQETSACLQHLNGLYAQAQHDKQKLEADLEWFSDTYQKRSLIGLISEYFKRKFKRLYLGLIDRMLVTNRVRSKYALRYSLEYIKENGLIYTLRSALKAVRKDGFGAVSRRSLRSRAERKLQLLSPPVIVPGSQRELIDVASVRDQISAFSRTPLVSILVPTYNTRPDLLEKAVSSVKNQLYEKWELIIVDDCSPSRETVKALKKYSTQQHIKVIFLQKNAGISEATNKALNVAAGEYIALMDHDDEMTPDALFEVVSAINSHPEVDIIYSDECKIDEAGILSDYFYKPDWSPELMLNMMYIGHLTAYRRSFLNEQIGGFRKEFDFSQDYDFALRAMEKTAHIHHIRKVLYYWRITAGSASQGDKPYARVSNLAALEVAMQRRGVPADIVELPTANRAKIRIDELLGVSIVIPTDSYQNLSTTIDSILGVTDYPNFDIVPVTNSRVAERIELNYHQADNVNIVRYDKPYNFSDKCNQGASSCEGAVVIFLNDDVRPLTGDWIQACIELLSIDGVGGVSPKLIYEDDTIQYAGMATGVRNLTGTVFHGYDRNAAGYINFIQSVRNVSILSGACMAMRRDFFLELGGFDSVNTPSSHSDVDLSFKIIDAGRRCVYTPYATLRHIGHQSLREYENKPGKFKKDKADIFLLKRWVTLVHDDPYFTPSMRRLLYHDSPEHYQIYPGSSLPASTNAGDILLVSHDLSLSGAPIVLLDIARTLRKLGYFVVVTSPVDGRLRHKFQKEGITVIIDELILRQHPTFERFARNFDFLICNTIVTWPAVTQMQTLVPVIWWLHEGKVLDNFTNNPEVVKALKQSQRLITVSDYALSFIKKYNRDAGRIFNTCPDIYTGMRTAENKFIISLIGSIESRKGHDLVVQACEKIDQTLFENVEIRFIGRIHDPSFYTELLNSCHDKPYIRFIGEKSHEGCLLELQESNVIINASRDDPFPLTLVEAFCCAKVCIISSNTGFRELVEDGVNGFIFKSGNATDLALRISEAVKMGVASSAIGVRARETYLEKLSNAEFERALSTYLETINQKELVEQNSGS